MNTLNRLSTPRSKSAQAFIDPHKVDWNLLKSFCLVSDLGSLTRAAAALGVSQPTVSRQIAELEAVVGAPLFERGARGLSLTAAGRALVEPSRRMLAAAQATSVAAAGQNHEVAGTVRVTASEMLSAFVLPAMLMELRTLYPDVQIELIASDQVGNLLTREADIALRMVRPQQSGLVTRKIAAFPMAFYAHRDYLKRHGKIVDSSQLAQHEWVGLVNSTQLIEGFRRAGFQVDKTFFGFRCDSSIVGWQAVLSGLGIGITMKVVAKQFPQVTQVLEQQPLPDLPVWLTAHRELRSAARIRAVYDFLAEALTTVQRA